MANNEYIGGRNDRINFNFTYEGMGRGGTKLGALYFWDFHFDG